MKRETRFYTEMTKDVTRNYGDDTRHPCILCIFSITADKSVDTPKLIPPT